MTKRQHLNNELVGQKFELERAIAVLHVLQYGTDQEATASLARLRLGSSIEQEYFRLLPQIPSLDAIVSAKSLDRTQLPTPANEQSEGPRSWGCLARGTYGEWNTTGMDSMDWTKPVSPMSQHSSTMMDNTAAGPYLDMKAGTPNGNDIGEEPLSCIGG
ncbi:uncharacterized protein RCC_05436 [Ramularia collo-cygni]|uniref:Uncharacterized protein n=1 Tax=Ramularia collo-cygni TaxID=112498 RepID=A0A2D3UYU6_9PEZI|nr:uncharacterized protein RCC_05436 [Ramularia collo-cygni]CZT19585.1 uncharacterized protein RCC_05436 [Ramularia collo-cygni]